MCGRRWAGLAGRQGYLVALQAAGVAVPERLPLSLNLEDMDALEDWTLWLRYAWNHRFAYVPKVTSLYRTPSDAEKIKERSNAFSAAYPIAVARAAAFAQTFGKTS